MSWFKRHWRRVYWPVIATLWLLIGAEHFAHRSYRFAIRTPPTIPCVQGMTLLPGQSCVGMLEIRIRPGLRAREGTSY